GELDESLVGGCARGSGQRGRASPHKTLVAVSAEHTPQGGFGRAHLRVIENVSAKTLANVPAPRSSSAVPSRPTAGRPTGRARTPVTGTSRTYKPRRRPPANCCPGRTS